MLALAGSAAAQVLPSEARLRERIARLVEITRASPRDVGSWHDLATLYRQVSEWDLAVAAETKAVEQHPRYAAAFWGRGKAYFGRRSFADARADFTAAIDLWQARGGLEQARECQDILRRLGAHDDAAALAKRIEDARPKSDLPR